MKESLRVGEGAEGAVRSKYATKPPGFSDSGGLRRSGGCTGAAVYTTTFR